MSIAGTLAQIKAHLSGEPCHKPESFGGYATAGPDCEIIGTKALTGDFPPNLSRRVLRGFLSAGHSGPASNRAEKQHRLLTLLKLNLMF